MHVEGTCGNPDGDPRGAWCFVADDQTLGGGAFSGSWLVGRENKGCFCFGVFCVESLIFFLWGAC